ncbi:MAG: hypothetical protein BWZ01_02602 [Deltaproteobacteria bacterium ADurb.BinA179]|nr:MAG: hypothetical protein BWZ01_02602 [Deltaproteobacteria bacterium ADurb.BinA179]
MRDIGDGLHVGHSVHGVADALDEDGPGTFAQSVSELIDVIDVHETHRDAQIPQGALEEVGGTAVERPGRDDLVAALGDGEYGVEDRRAPRGNGHRAHSSLEERYSLLEDAGSGIADPRIDAPAFLSGKERRGMIHVPEGKGCALVDGYGPRPAGAVGRVAAVDLDRVELQRHTNTSLAENLHRRLPEGVSPLQ